MNNRRLFLPVLLLLLVFLVFIIRRWNEPKSREAFNRSPAALTFTKHALCRMQCREIDRGEIEEIMKKGVINFNKSNRRGRGCPTFAVQGRTTSGESIRVIFAQCPSETRVVTCYNLEREFPCECSGPSPGADRSALTKPDATRSGNLEKTIR